MAYLIAFLIFIFFIALNWFIIKIIDKGKWSAKLLLINLLIAVIYNSIAWTYILNYMGEGGASLGPGLLMMGITFVHFVALVLCITIKQSVDRNKP